MVDFGMVRMFLLQLLIMLLLLLAVLLIHVLQMFSPFMLLHNFIFLELFVVGLVKMLQIVHRLGIYI